MLHDMFAVRFEQIAPIVDRTPEATRQLASRARQRVRGATPAIDADLATQREVVDAFRAASRDGDFDALLAVLDPDVVLRADGGPVPNLSHHVRGAEAVARQAVMWSRVEVTVVPALVNGAVGLVSMRDGELFSVMGVTVAGGRIAEMNILVDPERLRALGAPALGG